VVRFRSGSEKPVFVHALEQVGSDGSGVVELVFWVESTEGFDMANLERTMPLFVRGADEVLETMFPQLPFKRQNPLGNGNDLDEFGVPSSLSESQASKLPYDFRMALDEALDHQLSMASQPAQEIVQMILRQLRAL